MNSAVYGALSDNRGHLSIDVSRQLGAWIASLENSAIKGVRSLTDQERSTRDAARRQNDFLDHLRQVREGRPRDDSQP